ncbi:G2/M phase-specific E3 ubiquitin-protein ligase-like, partial [Clarias magur]
MTWTLCPHITPSDRRIFHVLLMIEVQSALGIFEGKQGQVFFAYNQTALEQNRFYTGRGFGQISQCTSVSDLNSLKANLADWIADCGVHWIYTAGLSDMLGIYSLVIKHFIYHRPASMISQFKAGVNSCGLLWQIVENNWKVFKPLFTNTQKPLSRSEFRDLLVVNWSQDGSNRRETEEETIFYSTASR